MDSTLIKGIINEANENNLIKVYVFSEPIRITKKNYFIDVYDDADTIEIIKKSGKVRDIGIDIDSIKYIEVEGPENFGLDPIMDMKK